MGYIKIGVYSWFISIIFYISFVYTHMVKKQVSLRIDKDFWDTLPTKNKSEWIRNILDEYINGNLIKNDDIKAIEQENNYLHNYVERLEEDKQRLHTNNERLWAELEQYRAIYLPKPKKWYQFWK